MKSLKRIMFGFAVAGMGLMVSGCGEVGNNLLNNLATASATMLAGSQNGQNTTGTDKKSQMTAAGVGILAQLLQGMTSGGAAQQGTKKTYTGTYTGQLLAYNKSQKNYANSGKLATQSNATTTLVVGTSSTGITMPAITAGDAKMTQVTLTNLVASNGKYGLGDNSTAIEGQLTYGGKTYDLANAYVELTYNDTACTYSASIYFAYDEAAQAYLYAMNVTFK